MVSHRLHHPRWHTILGPTLSYVALASVSILFVLPLYWMVRTSVTPKDQIFIYPPLWIPSPIKWSNYIEALTSSTFDFLTFTQNSLIYALSSTLGMTFSASLVAYSFARLRWPGRDLWFIVTLATMMVPYPVTLIPLFLVFKWIGWINTLLPLIVPNLMGTAFFIFLMRQFFLTIPRELTDAARVDGAGELGIYWRIMLPLSKPALTTVALFTFIWTWNDFLGPLIYLNDQKKYVLALGLAMFQGQYRTEWDLMMAAATVVTLPIVVLFFLAQKQFMQGITMTGLKG
jgi:multiple sugar transport system permease protein